MMVPFSSPRPRPAGASLRRTYWLQAPGVAAQVDHELTRA